MSPCRSDEVRPWARAIKTKVVSRQMPPWHAEGEQGKWRNDRRLSQAEIDKIVAWVDGGTPRGSDRRARSACSLLTAGIIPAGDRRI